MAEFGSLETRTSGIEFINMYSEENNILSENEIAYFCFQNNADFHFPMIAKGTVTAVKTNEAFEASYMIRIDEFLDNKDIYNKFVYRKVISLSVDGIAASRLTHMTRNVSLVGSYIYVNCFFVRNSYEKISKLRSEYIKYIKRDIDRIQAEISFLASMC